MPDDLYPSRLIPHDNYICLECDPFVEQGYIVRCLKKPAEFDSAGMLLENSFQFPQRDHWITHFSVNLLGNHKLIDSAWQYGIDKNSLRFNEFYKPWKEGEMGIYPGETEAVHPGPGNWGYFWIPLKNIHKEKFNVGADEYTCAVVHRPTKINFWHFELHFFNASGQDTCDLYENGKITKGNMKAIVSGIRAKLLSVSKSSDIKLDDWPTDKYQKVEKKKSILTRVVNFLFLLK